MKTINRICQVLCVVFSVAALVLFFMPFVTYTLKGDTFNVMGTQLAFGGKIDKKFVGEAVKMAVSSKLLFAMILTALSVVMSAFSFKKKGLRYVVPVVALGDAIFMLVAALSHPAAFVDSTAFFEISGGSMSYKYGFTDGYIQYFKLGGLKIVLWLSIALFACAIFGAAYLFIDDYLEVKASKGKKTIMQRLGLFFRDYKSEVKKIVWPTLSEVVKNTVIVLIMCLLLGILIWVIDYGLGEGINALLNIKK
ncbi:MAG: preprotein translocase subunit SecE [Clostridia bacterium]|nr:preprotein translocase subunit SecE [Clostridia bacterium]